MVNLVKKVNNLLLIQQTKLYIVTTLSVMLTMLTFTISGLHVSTYVVSFLVTMLSTFSLLWTFQLRVFPELFESLNLIDTGILTQVKEG